MAAEPVPRSRNLRSLLAHERALVLAGQLVDVTHAKASSVWLRAESRSQAEACAAVGCSVAAEATLVYRHMADEEYSFLALNNALPDTMPYQTIVEGPDGRAYCEKYLSGTKFVDTFPTTVVEFAVPAVLMAQLFAIQHKAEDGVLSVGLGFKAGGGLPLFNAALSHAAEQPCWRIVAVKRRGAGSKRH